MFLGQGPVEGIESFLHGESGESDAPFNGAVASQVGLALDESFEHGEVVGLAPRRRSARRRGSARRMKESLRTSRWAWKASRSGRDLRRVITRSSGQVVEGEVGLREFEFEQVGAPSEVQRRGLGERAGSGFEEVGDVVAGERAEVEGVVEGARGGIGTVDFAERDDFAHVMDGVEAAVREFAVILVGARR